ncbi:MAG: fructose-bisphosphate aldolase class I [Patescibacteria group bacterium]|nr:fructose-bisphosphate aldolase class I [Patescibacteria group bacterium]
MDKKNLFEIAKKMVAPKKGILAADESLKTMTKRLETIGVESTLENRSIWRQIMVEAEGVENYISGIILYDETLRNPLPNGKMIADILKEKGVFIGIKTDEGTYKFNNHEETFTLGLDKLEKRYEEYKQMGAVFAKWRAVYKIGEDMPSKASRVANAIGLAQYALITQKAGLVPIVEPEVLVLEGDHDIEKSEEETEEVLEDVFKWLERFNIDFSGMLLKPNMVLAGKECLNQPKAEEIAERTVKVLKKTVPKEVPGIVFLSGGLSPDEATEYLKKMNEMYKSDLPWQLSYSYGRALQQEALKVWSGKSENIAQAQKVFIERCKKVSEARG